MALELGPRFKNDLDWLEVQHYANNYSELVIRKDVLLRTPYSDEERQKLISELGDGDFNPYVDNEGNLTGEVIFDFHDQEGYNFVFVIVAPKYSYIHPGEASLFVKSVLEELIYQYHDYKKSQ